MKAAVLREFGKIVIEDVPDPHPSVNEVVVRVKACGICQTDYKSYLGKRTNIHFPFIMGHEPAGVVASVGPGVTEFVEGDEVIIAPAGFCGLCRWCRVGMQHRCDKRFTCGGDGGTDIRHGCFAEYSLHNASSIYHKPKNISWAAAALTEPLAGSWKGLIDYSQMRVGEDVIVIGVGSIGMLVLMLARAAGAGRLIAIDVSDYALKNALDFGATHALNPESIDVRRAVYDIMPEGPDLIVEAAGPIEAVRMMFDLRRRGTRINLFGITTPETVEFNGGETHWFETRMDASFSINSESMVNAIRLIECGLVDTEKIVTHRFPLSETDLAMQTMAIKDRNKVMVFPDESELT